MTKARSPHPAEDYLEHRPRVGEAQTGSDQTELRSSAPIFNISVRLPCRLPAPDSNRVPRWRATTGARHVAPAKPSEGTRAYCHNDSIGRCPSTRREPWISFSVTCWSVWHVCRFWRGIGPSTRGA